MYNPPYRYHHPASFMRAIGTRLSSWLLAAACPQDSGLMRRDYSDSFSVLLLLALSGCSFLV